ncbi:serine hydroxymethyltransferase [Halomonas smyrnensis]|uniref:serine hydroxymethyltransferase n=1 Tax=Halomonas smyrnensis TaxID=720605 RepID=UPI0002DC25CA|nr:serine hydroxymethyltransferase [Halomonas smyrnensis]
MNDNNLTMTDPQIAAAIGDELARQEAHIELIASENYASPQVMAAQGSQLTNKYAEGYPGKRYYGGCEYVDVVEQLAIDYAKELFGATYANVQPHSGSQANGAVFQALVTPGDTVLGMSLDAGGHLTHGAKPNFSGKHYNAVQYGIDENGRIDYEQVAELAREHQPKMIIAGFSAYSQIIDWAKFREIADEVGAYLLVDMAHIAGLVAAGVYPSPMSHAHVVTTTTHKTLRGPRGGLILSAEGNADIEKKLQSAVFPGIQGGPLEHVIAAKAICFKEAMAPEFKTYQQQVLKNAKAMAGVFIERGFDIVSGGTDDHLFLVSLIKQGVTGKDADAALGRSHITVNKNAVPGDPQSPFVTSGLRLGTPAVTTRGFSQADCEALAGWICDILDVLEKQEDTSAIEAEVRGKVAELCARHPVYAKAVAEQADTATA